MYCTLALAASVPTSQDTKPPACVQPGDAHTKVAPEGTGLVISTLVALAGPAFDAVIV